MSGKEWSNNLFILSNFELFYNGHDLIEKWSLFL